MKLLPVLALTFAVGFGSAAVLHAEDTPAETPVEKKSAKAMKVPRLTKPWSDMNSLTNEQKVKIGAIHKASVAEKKKLDEQEDTDIMALLTDEQKAEATKVKEEGTAAGKRKAKAGGAAGTGAATTQPTAAPADGM